MFTTTANFKGLLSGVSNPDFIIGIDIDWRFFMVAVVVAEIGITRLTNLFVSSISSSPEDWRVSEVEMDYRTYLKGHFADFCIRLNKWSTILIGSRGGNKLM